MTAEDLIGAYEAAAAEEGRLLALPVGERQGYWAVLRAMEDAEKRLIEAIRGPEGSFCRSVVDSKGRVWCVVIHEGDYHVRAYDPPVPASDVVI